MNSRIALKEKRMAAAKTLYLDGFEQKTIAKIMKTSEPTVSKWVREGNWKDERIKKNLRQDNIIERVQKLIEYQLNAIDENLIIAADARERHNQEQEEKGEPKNMFMPLISKGEIDALSKLNAMIKHKNVSWMHVVNTMKVYMEHLQIKDLALAKQSIEAVEQFLQIQQELLK